MGRIARRKAVWAERAATTAAFLAGGIGIGAWATSIPGFESAPGLSDEALIIALLGFAVGAVATMQLAGPIAHWLGTAHATRLGMLLFAGALLLAPLAPSLATLVGGALAVGAGHGLLDVLMNTQASTVAVSRGRASRCRLTVLDSRPYSGRRPVGRAPAVFPAISPLLNARFGGYPAFVATELAVHRGDPG